MQDIYDYIYVSQGKTKVESIDDNEELEYTEDAFNVLGFSEEEKFNCYTLTAGVMTCGGIEFKTKGRDDQVIDFHLERFLILLLRLSVKTLDRTLILARQLPSSRSTRST